VKKEANPLAKHGRLSYLEIPAMDPRQSAAFYEGVFGWKIDQRSKDDFRFSVRDELLIGRWATGRVASREAGILPFIYVDDIEGAIRRVTAGGGEIVKAPYAEGDVQVARIRDPAGNLVGMWQFS